MTTGPRDAMFGIKRATAAVYLLAACGGATARSDDHTAFFESRIRPLLERDCVECHSGDDASGGVRFTDRAGWADAGVVEPGRPEESRLLEVLRPFLWHLDRDHVGSIDIERFLIDGRNDLHRWPSRIRLQGGHDHHHNQQDDNVDHRARGHAREIPPVVCWGIDRG